MVKSRQRELEKIFETERSLEKNPDQMPSSSSEVNLSNVGRIFSASLGTLALFYGVSHIKNAKGWVAAALGLSLVNRGVSGHCVLYEAMDVNTAPQGLAEQKGLMDPHPFQIHQAMTIWKTKADVYRLLNDIHQFKKVIPLLQEVEQQQENQYLMRYGASDERSFDVELERVSQVADEKLNFNISPQSKLFLQVELILKDAAKPNATEIYARLTVHPPAGALGSAIMKSFGPVNQQVLKHILHRMKQLAETGEVATVQEQASGRKTKTLYELPMRVVEFVDKLRDKSQQFIPERKEAS
ncbi:MAG: YgaP-like transmembrane domain [Oligoflexus sp.]